jgi:hypothetical protein
MRLKQPLPRSEEVLGQVKAALTPDWRKLLICIDGADGLGKSSLALWLAWQLGAVAIAGATDPTTCRKSKGNAVGERCWRRGERRGRK